MEEKLQKIFSNVNEWLKFAEAKNFGLLTLNAAIIFGLSQSNFEKGTTELLIAFYLIIPIAFISSFFSLLSLFPILTKIEKGKKVLGGIAWLSNLIDKEELFENIHFYGYIRTLKKDEFISKIKNKTELKSDFTAFEEELVVQILYNSRITWLKYQLFKIAGFVSLIGLIISTFLYIIILIVKSLR